MDPHALSPMQTTSRQLAVSAQQAIFLRPNLLLILWVKIERVVLTYEADQRSPWDAPASIWNGDRAAGLDRRAGSPS